LAVDNNFPGKLDELEEAAAFLHENGILLHYEDPSLSDLYFINPQWLCTMLACVVTVQEKNPFQKNGFMDRSALRLVLRDERFPHSFLQDFVSLMQKFEVVLVLDDDHLLIPSLLPTDKKQACTVLPFVVISTKSVDPVIIEQLNHLSYAPIHEINMKLYSRYYLIPYIPDGFFPRLIARIIGGDIATCFSECTDNSKFDLINGFHWKCWRSGIILIYHHMEIARVSMMELPYPNIENVYVTSSAGTVQLDKNSKGIEIVLAVLPDHIVTSGSQFLPLNDNDSYSNYLAVWMLRKLIETIDSVFEEWYEGFARRKKFDLHVMQQICPCPLCLSNAFYLINQRRNVKKTTSTNSMNRNTTSPRRLSGDTSYISYHDLKQWKDMYMFTGQFCVLEYSNGKGLRCANHDYIPVSSVAPDLAFSDFSPSMLFHKPQTVITKLENLGSGGFGSVNRGFIEDVQLSVAIKEFTSIAGKMIDNPKIAEEISSWDVYLNGSREARMMHRLRHPNVLGLVGLAFQPLRLLLELAPLGDLKKCLKPFKRDKVKLSRKVLRDVMYQVADAMEYIHSQSIIYRDLKPGNVLVWRFPQPKSQWNLDEFVLIKLADYGISKHCTPEGARGSEGTPVYLPPEVILHGGAAAFTTKLDVYSFAMFMYYLFTYNGPFENEKGRPICSLLEKGKRPELNPKQQPLALQMYELMCWCWSDSPNHRPTFAQIKQIISSHSFVQLLKCVPLQSQDTFTVASLHTFKPTLSLRRRYKDEDLLKGKHSAASPSPSILQILSLNTDNDEVFNIYYGTRKGQIGIFQVFAEYDSCNPIDDVGCPVTCITSVGINVWIGTWGGGILVYNSATNAKIATWKANEGACVYKLLYVPEHGSMVVLSSQSFAIIDTSISKEEYIVQLETSFTYASDSSLTTGTVVLPYGYTDDTEVWCCSLRDNVIKIFSHLDLKVPNQESVPIVSSRKEMQLKHLVCYHKEEKNKVLISDNWFLQFWDVHDRQRERDDLNCSEICSKAYNGEVKNCSITSLLVSRSTIYIGTAGGIIIMLNVDSLEATYLLHGHDSDITSILSVSQAGQIRRFSRMLSKKDSFITTPVSPVFPETSSITSMASYSESVSYSESDVILSFGQGYSSILGESANYPSNFILPSHSSSSNLLASHNPRWMPSKSIKTGCILYWSSSDYYMSTPDELCQSSRSSGFTTIPETSIETAYSST
jgi:serine/threonine protein kinase